MSAIFGIIDKASRPIDMRDKALMQDRLMHHASDGAAYYEEEGCFLGHHQQITNNNQRNEALPLRSGNLVITSFAGITNRETLAKLLGLSADRHNCSDPALILEAFRKWGKDCVKHFEGEFAFVIWNETERTLFGASDHVGLRTFCYYNSADRFVFASEVKAVLAAKPTPHLFNEHEIIAGVTKKYNEQTFVKDVLLLTPGCTLTVQSNGLIEKKRYWQLQPPGRYSFSSNAEWGECLRQLLRNFLADKMNTDGKIGVMFSGGLDSSFVAAIAAEMLREQNKTLYAFAGRLPDAHYTNGSDERYYQDLMAGHIPNLELVCIQPEPQTGPFSNVDLTAYEEDGLPNIYHYLDTEIYSAAKARNVTILLNGFMGDLSVSRRRHDVVYRLIREGRFKTAIKLFNQLRENYNEPVTGLLRSDIFQHLQVWNLIRSFRDQLSHKKDRVSGFSASITDVIMKLLQEPIPFNKGLDYIPFVVNDGTLGFIMNVYNKRNAWFGFDKGSPLVSKPILEFTLDVPKEVFLSNGFRRGLIREGMAGIVPPEIRWRKEKSMYTPDFYTRLINQKKQIEQMLNDDAYADYMKFSDKNDIVRSLGQLNDTPGNSDWFTSCAAFSAMSISVMKSFSEKLGVIC